MLCLVDSPTTPSFRYQQMSGGKIGNASLDVVIGDTFNIVCNSSAQPQPNYIWQWNDNIIESQTLTLTSVLSEIIVTCIVHNVMNETFGESRDGIAEANLSVHILCTYLL